MSSATKRLFRACSVIGLVKSRDTHNSSLYKSFVYSCIFFLILISCSTDTGPITKLLSRKTNSCLEALINKTKMDNLYVRVLITF